MGSIRSEGASFKIAQFGALRDNYGFLLHDPSSGATAAIDTPEVEPIVATLREHSWKLTHILNTHHHADHTGGNQELKTKYPGVVVVGPRSEQHKVRGGIDVPVEGTDRVLVGSLELDVIDVGGHTLGHVAYYSSVARSCFVGDSIFALGCGRMFEGTPEQFHKTLQRLMDLPDDTKLFCAHEYTEANAKFAATIETDNEDLLHRIDEIKADRAKGLPTVPTTVELEKRTNPFVRINAVRKALALPPDTPDHMVFAELRRRKDRFP
ncbi:hypothetical protein CTAYLR_000568 [Chrysophaeum taylorii]|uniref:hydroxyacylglutathione hydrolase n=1 Tax=Chrysophaeum taylorii TaxID=2483200 RepID=A0AAD7XNF3_9STRA|nr:hypothetical protein CTAYLR_000568 [Chrysophaeum taylorii]